MRIEMPEKRKKYDREFREGAVRIVEETGKPIAQVARDPGAVEGTLGTEPGGRGPVDWVKQTRVPHTVGCALLGVSLAWFYTWLGRAQGPGAGQRPAHAT